MRHRVKDKHFNRDTKGRKALFKSLLLALFEHGAIETTETKAKAMKRLADKVIGRAMPRTLNARRVLERFFGSKQAVNRVVDGVAPTMQGRMSGFTRIVRLGHRRGDDAEMVKLELVNPPVDKPAVTVATPEVKLKPVKAKNTSAKTKKAVKVSQK